MEDQPQQILQQCGGDLQRDRCSLAGSLKLSLQPLTTLISAASLKQGGYVLPVMVEISACEDDSGGSSSGCEHQFQIQPSRTALDMILVIDLSISMRGRKMSELRKTIRLILGLLNESDRLALVGFNNSAQQLVKLLPMSISNKKIVMDILSNILPMGLTNIAVGLVEGLKVLRQIHIEHEKEMAVVSSSSHASSPPRVRSIFLLSDGVDDRCQENMSLLRSEIESIPVEFSLHTFGYGEEKDAGVLSEIAGFKQGNFYFVEDIKNTDLYFANALGDLFAVVSSQAHFVFHLRSKQQSHELRFAGVYGDMWATATKSNESEENAKHFKLNQLFSGVKKQVFFEVALPSTLLPGDVFTLGQGELTVESLDGETLIRTQEVFITVSEESGVESVEVKASFLRACGAQALQYAIDLTIAQDLEGSLAVLERALANFSEQHFPQFTRFPELLSLRRDILECLDNITRRLGGSALFYNGGAASNNSQTQLSCSTSHSTQDKRESDLFRETALKIRRTFLGKSKAHMEQKSIMIELDQYRTAVHKTILREIKLAKSALQSLDEVEEAVTNEQEMRKPTDATIAIKRKQPLISIQRKKFASMNVALDSDLNKITEQ